MQTSPAAGIAGFVTPSELLLQDREPGLTDNDGQRIARPPHPVFSQFPVRVDRPFERCVLPGHSVNFFTLDTIKPWVHYFHIPNNTFSIGFYKGQCDQNK